MSIRKRILFAGLALTLLSGSLSGCQNKPASNNSVGSENAAEKPLTVVRVGVMADFADSYFPVVGTANGTFQKYGLEVKATTFSQGINTVDAVTLNQLDIGMAADFAALNRFGSSSKNDLRIFTTLLNSKPTGNSFYVKEDLVREPKDLEGKSIVTIKGTVMEYWNSQLLKQNGVDEKKVGLLPVQSLQEGIALMQSGQAAGIWVGGQAETQLKEIKGVKKISDIGTIHSQTISLGIASQSYLQNNRKTVENYLKALNEIQEFIEKNPEKAAEIVQQKTNAPKEQVLSNLDRVVLGIGLEQNVVDTLDGINAWCVENGKIKNKIDPRDYINAEALKAVFPDKVNYQ